MNKHAYLIMTYNQFYILEKLLQLIDDERNDIFIHVDRKVKNFDVNYFKKLIKKSNIFFIDRYDIRWADISQTMGILSLLEESRKNGPYRYYHLLSGTDLPLKTQDEIHKFFRDNDKEYIHFCTIENRINNMYKYNVYWFFTKYLRGSIKSKFLRALNMILRYLQKNFFGIDRCKRDKLDIKIGANWFSITDALASYLLDNKKWILSRYKNTMCSDESFIQTLVYNSSIFRNRLSRNGKEDNNYLACMRYIDWKRGNPYVWTMNDFKELMQSEYLFAIKFDINKDKMIVDKIYDTLNKKM